MTKEQLAASVAPRVGRSVWLAAVVQKHYQPITGAEAIKCAGAQQMDGQWWMPLWGCDTLDHLLEDVDYAAAEKPRKHQKLRRETK